LAHVNVTAHPSADWTLQQLREVVWTGRGYRYLIHDRDRLFAKHLDNSIRALGVEVLRSPFASPKANAICKRVVGTARRECLEWLIPISEAHLRSILKCWVAHYTADVRIARWDLVCRILQRNLRNLRSLSPGIDWRRVRSCLRDRCWADCITTIRLQQLRRS